MTLTLVLAVAAAPLIVAYVVACLRDPMRYAMPPFAASLPFSSLIAVGPGPFGSVSSLLGLLLGVALVAQMITTRRSAARLPLTVPVWLGFLAYCGLSVFWSVDPAETVARFAVLASLVLLFVALVLTGFDRRSLRLFENAILVGGLLSVAYGLFQLVVLGGAPTPDGGAARFGNDLLGPNNQAAALLLPLAIAAGRALSDLPGRRWVHGVFVLVLSFGVVMTGSRGGLLAMVLTLGVVLFIGAVRRGVAVALGAAAATLLLVVLLVNPAGVGARQIEDSTDSSGRAEIWAVGMHACQEHCLTGAGWGSFPTVYGQERASVPQARVLDRGTAFEAHNVFLLVAVETGAIGLLLVVTGLALTMLSGWRLPRALRGPPVAALLGTVLTAFFLSNFEYKYFWAVLIYVSMSVTVVESARGPRSRGARAALRPPAPAGQDVR